MALDTSVVMMRVAGGADFRQRLAFILAQIAMSVRVESAATTHHDKRDELAQYILADPQQYANRVAAMVAGRTNLIAAGAEMDRSCEMVSLVTDAALLSQLTADWNVMAGVPST